MTTAMVVTESTTTMSYIEIIVSFIPIPSIVTQFFLWANLVSFIIGFTGNIFSLLTFSSSTLRVISTSCLFIVLAVSDTLFLLVKVIDFVEYGLQIRLYRQINYDALCQFRAFVLYVPQLFSAWLLILITIDRWIRTKFPFKANSFCTPKKFLITAGILFVLVIALNSHILLPYFSMILPGIPQLSCGPNDLSYEYAIFYIYQWTIILIFTTSVVPSVVMFVLIIHMIFMIRAQKNMVLPHRQSINGREPARQEKRNQNQMFILMLSNVSIFLITTLPLTMSYIISIHTVTGIYDIPKSLTVITILNYIQQLNCCINFYIRCLTSTLFRNEFLKLIGFKRDRNELRFVLAKTTKSIQLAQMQTQTY